MANTRRKATKAKSRKSLTKAKSRKRTVAAKSRKSVAKKAKPAKRAAKSKARQRLAGLKSRKPVASSKARKPAKKTTSRRAVTKPKSVKPLAKSPKAVRLTFSYQGDQVKLVSQQPVEMTVPPSDSLKGYEDHKGFWAEVKSAQDKGHEVTLSRSSGAPDIEAGGGPKGKAAMRSLATGPATEIARFKLKK